MGDSSSFSSLFALVDNHLSKSNIHQDCQPSTSGLSKFNLPPLNVQRGLSDTGLGSSSMKFPIPSLSLSAHPINNALPKPFHNRFFNSEEVKQEEEEPTPGPSMSMSDCPINDVLAIQLSNMFKAREAREEEERKRQQELKKVEEHMQKLQLQESSCLIDLMPAVQQSCQIQPQHVELPSSSTSMESLNIPDASDSIEDEPQEKPNLDTLSRPVSPKPIKTDMSYALKHKLGRCSQFGKVLCARYRPVAAPYFRVHVPHNIKVFDFSTPSPDDIIAERLRKPSFYTNSNNSLTVFD